MMKNKILLIVITLLGILILGGCDLMASIDNEQENLPELDYVIMVNSDVKLPLTNFNTLNPIYSDNFYYYHFSKLIFESLFTYDESYRIIPQLASNWSINQDGSKILINLREDVYFHNGNKFTSDDVVYTINTMKRASDNSIYYKLLNGITPGNVDKSIISAQKLDDYSLEITVGKNANFVLDALTFPIISSSLGEGGLSIEDYDVIGTGPYKFVEYVKFKEIKLEAFQDYREGSPEIKYIIGKIFEDEELILTAFETGKLNVSGSIGVDWDKYVHNPRVDIKEYVTADFDALSFNHNNPLFQGENGIILKKSIMYGIDRQELISKIYLGHGTQTDTPIHPDHYLSSSNSSQYGYTPQRSLELLDSMTFKEEDPLKREDYENLSLKLLVNSNNDDKIKVAEMIKSNLSNIGINIIIESVSEDQGLEYSNRLLSGNYDIAIVSWKQSIIQKFDHLFFENNIGISNTSRFIDDEFESLLAEISLYNNESDNLLKYDVFQKEFTGKLPYGILMYRNRALLIDSNIKGDLSPNFFNLYNGLSKSYLIMRTN